MLDPTFRITTPRLQITYLNPDNDAHCAFKARLVNSPEMIALREQIPVKMPPPLDTIEAVRTAMGPAVEKQAKTGYGRYIVSLRRDTAPATVARTEETFIGTVSMQFGRYHGVSAPLIPDLGFGLHSDYYGKGYASEACEALLQHFQETKGLDTVAGFTHPDNVQSQKLFKRLGFVSRGVRDVGGILGEGSRSRVAVWLWGTGKDEELEKFGI